MRSHELIEVIRAPPVGNLRNTTRRDYASKVKKHVRLVYVTIA